MAVGREAWCRLLAPFGGHAFDGGPRVVVETLETLEYSSGGSLPVPENSAADTATATPPTPPPSVGRRTQTRSGCNGVCSRRARLRCWGEWLSFTTAKNKKPRRNNFLRGFSRFRWSGWRDSNPRPLAPHTSTLPAALHPESGRKDKSLTRTFSNGFIK